MRRVLDDPALRRLARPWAVLLGLVVLQLLLAALGAGMAAPLVGLVMTGVVLAVPMELPSAPNAARVFALAGAFWLVFILFGLGMLDPLTRHDPPTQFQPEP